MSLYEEVRRLAEIVPREPGTSLPPGVSLEQIERFAIDERIEIPPEVRAWLQFSDGPCIGPGGINGLADIKSCLTYGPEFHEKQWLPISSDGCGGLYVVAAKSEDLPLRPVYFIDPYVCRFDAPTYAVASEFWRFLWFLFQEELGEERWPFDRDYVLKQDPDLANVRSALSPWIANERSGG